MKMLFIKNALATLAVLGLLAGSAFASPVTFDVDDSSQTFVDFTDIDTGIKILWWTFGENTTITAPLANLSDTGLPDFTLGDGESKTFDFFTFHVIGTGVGTFDLSANLSFITPDIDAGGEGSGAWGTISFRGKSFSGGIFEWDNPLQTFTLTDGNKIQISMLDGFTIGCGSDAKVTATVTNLGGAPVPEPGVTMLFGLGAVGFAGVLRARRKTLS